MGRVPYREAWGLQRALRRQSDTDYLLLLEHNPVYTLGAHGNPDHILVDPSTVGADTVRTDRGGDVTYHGPGQLVGYPIVSVGPGPHRGTRHVHRVEQVVIDALVMLGVPAGTVGRLHRFPGVWVGLDDPAGVPRKICAVGVRTECGRTTHGFALNVRTDLAMFSHIVPCGIADKAVTSLAAEGLDVTMADAVDAVIASAAAAWGPVEDVQRVTDGFGSDRSSSSPSEGGPAAPGVPIAFRRVAGERSLDRRLRQSGVDPDAGLPIGERKPSWLRVTARMDGAYLGLKGRLRELDLVTVCEEAGCPNIYECWSDGTATFMINGSRCTRACGFCQVDTRHPLPLDPDEPERVAEAVTRMGLAHAVVTCVARDDLADGGAGAFARTIAAIRRQSPRTTVEVLISDCKGDETSLQTIVDARPDVLNHNIETVARMQRAVRPSAGYARSLAVLARSAEAGLTTKSGLIVGMGESEAEARSTLTDLRAVGVRIVIIGQYLRPSTTHLPVARWWTPAEFESLRVAGMAMGFSHVQASPLTRSSYHARGRPGRRPGSVSTVPTVHPVS